MAIRRRIAGAASLLLAAMALGCGASTDSLARLAAVGLIDQAAPVKARVQIEIAAPPAKVWALLVDAPSWPSWQPGIESVSAAGPLTDGAPFAWRTGGTTVHSQVRLLEPQKRLAWTGTAMIAHAVHVWRLDAKPGGGTAVVVQESMDGPLMAMLFPSEKLASSDLAWLRALKSAAEKAS
jgi:uncharacterized protein YndB with AHSA1/START domain